MDHVDAIYFMKQPLRKSFGRLKILNILLRAIYIKNRTFIMSYQIDDIQSVCFTMRRLCGSDYRDLAWKSFLQFIRLMITGRYWLATKSSQGA